MEIINILLAVITIIFGGTSFFAPRYVMGLLDLDTTNSTMGLSEIRATLGGVYAALGLAAIVFGTGTGYQILGIAYLGAAIGRLVSVLRDSPPIQKVLGFFSIEVAFAAVLIIGNS